MKCWNKTDVFCNSNTSFSWFPFAQIPETVTWSYLFDPDKFPVSSCGIKEGTNFNLLTSLPLVSDLEQVLVGLIRSCALQPATTTTRVCTTLQILHFWHFLYQKLGQISLIGLCPNIHFFGNPPTPSPPQICAIEFYYIGASLKRLG